MRTRNVPRLNGAPVRATNTSPESLPKERQCSMRAWRANDGSGTDRRPARDFGYGLSAT
jgi:hypothetical protein